MRSVIWRDIYNEEKRRRIKEKREMEEGHAVCVCSVVVVCW